VRKQSANEKWLRENEKGLSDLCFIGFLLNGPPIPLMGPLGPQFH